MAQLAIDTETGDVALGPGGFYLVDGIEAIRQTLWLRLRTIKGELPYAANVGIPMVEEVTVRGTAPERVMAIYRDVILGTDGITGFASEPVASYDAANSVFSFTFRALTVHGTLDYSGTIPVVVT
mgnify:CR=1 FL=1|jgi:hypothetical protein